MDVIEPFKFVISLFNLLISFTIVFFVLFNSEISLSISLFLEIVSSFSDNISLITVFLLHNFAKNFKSEPIVIFELIIK